MGFSSVQGSLGIPEKRWTQRPLTLKIHAFSAALSALFASRTAGWHSMTVIEGCLPQLSCTKQLMPSHLVHDQAPPTDESSCESNTARRLCL